MKFYKTAGMIFLSMMIFLTACEEKDQKDDKTFADPKNKKSQKKSEPKGSSIDLSNLPQTRFLTNGIENEKNLIKHPSGMFIYVIEEGTGPKPQTGENVKVHYQGQLMNGKKFDSSWDRGQAFQFPLGQGRVIKGWDVGIAQLPVGSKAVLIIPSEMGYGARGAGADIPPNSPLVFDVELLGTF